MSNHCTNLENKKMYVPELRDRAFKEKAYPGFEGHFWCSQTAAEFGPDDRVVNLNACSDCNRECYKES